MGFTTGFTGGATLTLGIAYLTVLAHQRNRESQSHALRAQNHVLTALLDPQLRLPPPPATRSEHAARDRETLVESAKDRWNREVEGAVRWAQRTDWTAARERFEAAVASFWGGAVIDKTADAAAAAGPLARDVVEGARQKGAALAALAEEQGESARREARSAWERARDKAVAAEEAAREKAAEAKRAVDARAAEAKAVVGEAVEEGKRRGGEVLAKAAAAAGAAEAKADGADALPAKTSTSTSTSTSPVEKALHQRYEKKAGGVAKTVKEALAERYLRMDERDNSQLRGI